MPLAPSVTEPCPKTDADYYRDQYKRAMEDARFLAQRFPPTPLNIHATDLEIVACINAEQWERVTELQALANRLRREARHP